MNSDITDKRMCSRTHFTAYVELWEKEKSIIFAGKMTDVSMFGLYFLTAERLPVGTACEVKISIHAKSSRLTIDDIQATVVRHGEDGLGVSFSTSIEWFALFNVYSYYGKDEENVSDKDVAIENSTNHEIC